MTHFIMNSPQLGEDNYDSQLYKNFFLKLSKNSKISNKELKKVKEEKEYLIIQLSESRSLIDFLKSENTMLFETIESLEIKLKEFEDLLSKFL
jgi:hypothetical protein